MTLTKEAVRQEVYARRMAMPPLERLKADDAFTDNFLAHVTLPPAGSVVSAYMPFNAELNVKPLMQKLFEMGYRITTPSNRPNLSQLDFRTWTPDMPLRRNIYGIEESDPAHSEALLPDFMIVPLIAFDAQCNRLGYGSGQFDRSFAELLTVRKAFFAVGVAYDIQRVDAVPVDSNDFRLHMVVTEKNVYTSRTDNNGGAA